MMPEITKTKDQKPATNKQIVWLLFALAVVAVYFYGLNIPLLGPDEPRYAQIAREMFERGDWITPKLAGYDWFEKPALLYWLEIIAYKLFGVSEFAARFGSAIFGLLTVFSLWLLGRHAAADQAGNSGDASSSMSAASYANWMALIAATSIGLIVFSRAASFDIILTFPITAAMVAFFIFDIHDRRSRIENKPSGGGNIALAVFYFFIGVALIAKGLVGIIFPFGIVGFYYLLSRRLPNKTFILSLLWGTTLSSLTAAVWYLPMYQINGWKFIDEFIIQHHFQRFTSDKYRHHQPFWFFFAVLPLMTLPWLPFFLAAIWRVIKSEVRMLNAEVRNRKSEVRSQKPEIGNQNAETENQKSEIRSQNAEVGNQKAWAGSQGENIGKTSTLQPPPLLVSSTPPLLVSPPPLLLFSLAWLLVPLVFFSLSGSKLPGYILPSLPAALVLTGDYIYHFVRKSAERALFVRLTAFAVIALIVIVIGFFISGYAQNDTTKYLVQTANESGYDQVKITCLYNVDHNLEFYAPGRLVREPDGRLKYYDEFLVLVKDAAKEPNREMLVIVPQDLAPRLVENESTNADSEIIAKNAESALILIRAK